MMTMYVITQTCFILSFCERLHSIHIYKMHNEKKEEKAEARMKTIHRYI